MNEMERGELISALADGHVQGEDLEVGLEALEREPQAQLTWETYHLIGDVLRSPDLASSASSAAFLARLRPVLAREPLQMPPSAGAIELLPADPAAARTGAHAANDGSFRWKVAAGLASVAAVAAVGWSLVGGAPGVEQPQLAAAPAQPQVVQAAGQRNLMLRDARLDELLAAHRQFGSPAAIQMPIGAVRNAAFESPAR